MALAVLYVPGLLDSGEAMRCVMNSIRMNSRFGLIPAFGVYTLEFDTKRIRRLTFDEFWIDYREELAC